MRFSSSLGLVVLLSLMCVVGCGSNKVHNPVPADAAASAEIPGMPHVRTWGDDVSPTYFNSLVDSYRQEEAYFAANPNLPRPDAHEILVISGGGSDGAFGAGLLKGWSEAGNRPTFKLVSGISTGALTAPFAFLGPEHDETLHRLYTESSTKDILKEKGLMSMLTDDSVADTSPLAAILAREIDSEFLAKVAAEHDKGRRLLIGSVNLDAQRPVIWNMGEIAKVGTPQAEKLFQTVMLASASIPGAFPPQYIPVVANGKAYDEMHVDGGTVAQLFLWGGGLTGRQIQEGLGRGAGQRAERVYIIRNGTFSPAHKMMEPRFIDIAGRAVSTMIKYAGLYDAAFVYFLVQREGGDYNLASIPDSFTLTSEDAFDKQYMTALYKTGYDMARKGYPWAKAPPHTTRHPAKQP